MTNAVKYGALIFAVLLIALPLALAGTNAGVGEAKPKEAEWKDLSAGDKAYLDEYNKLNAKEETFTGTFAKNWPITFARITAYSLDDKFIVVNKNLDQYAGKRVEIIGKKDMFDTVEAGFRWAIHPLKIRLAAQEAPKAIQPKEVPAKPVKGLLFEIKLLNARPLLPGDKELDVEYRFENVGEKDWFQIVDNKAALAPKVIDAAGKGIKVGEMEGNFPVDKMFMFYRCCSLAPGCFWQETSSHSTAERFGARKIYAFVDVHL